MGTKWGEGKTHTHKPRVKSEILAAKYLASGGNLAAAAAKVGTSPAAAKKTLASMRDYLREQMGKQGLTVESVLSQLQYLAWTGENEMARLGALKVLYEHVKSLNSTQEDDISKMNMKDLLDFLKRMISDYEKKMTVEVQAIGPTNGPEHTGPAGDGQGDSGETGGTDQEG